MTKKKAAAHPLDIPENLKVENRKPLTPEQQATVDAAVKKTQEAAKAKLPSSVAKAVETAKAATDAAKAATEATQERRAKAKGREEKTKSIRLAREGLITVASIAQEYNLIPRVARGLLRDAKLKKPEHGWAYPKNDPELVQVRDVLKAGVVAKPKAEPKVVAKAEAKIPPPSETVWSSKANKTKGEPPKPSSAKATARSEIAAATNKAAANKANAVAASKAAAASKK
jgi:colicin import membrane protein